MSGPPPKGSSGCPLFSLPPNLLQEAARPSFYAHRIQQDLAPWAKTGITKAGTGLMGTGRGFAGWLAEDASERSVCLAARHPCLTLQATAQLSVTLSTASNSNTIRLQPEAPPLAPRP